MKKLIIPLICGIVVAGGVAGYVYFPRQFTTVSEPSKECPVCQKCEVEEVIKEVPVEKIVVKEVPVIKEVIKTVEVPSDNRIPLQNCLSEAETKYDELRKDILSDWNACTSNPYPIDCTDIFRPVVERNDDKLSQAKNDCYNLYPVR